LQIELASVKPIKTEIEIEINRIQPVLICEGIAIEHPKDKTAIRLKPEAIQAKRLQLGAKHVLNHNQHPGIDQYKTQFLLRQTKRSLNIKKRSSRA
jgi:hypothetical protein